MKMISLKFTLLYIIKRYSEPTLSLGINFKSEPCFINTLLAVWFGFIPIPVFVIIADVSAVTLNFVNILLLVEL